MKSDGPLYVYLPDGVSFVSQKATKIRTIYFPLCGPTFRSIKSSITPYLSGDIKIDQHSYLTKPASREDLRHIVRNFFAFIEGKGIFSIAQDSDGGDSYVEIGPLWHRLVKHFPQVGLALEAFNFVPITGENVELMRVTVRNVGRQKLQITPTVAIPIFARALINKHDHEHVTSLLNRIRQLPQGVLVKPTMLFDERGHQETKVVFFVFGISQDGEFPLGSYPTVNSFLGESGTLSSPEAIVQNRLPEMLSDDKLQGQEAMGALRFKEVTLLPGEQKEYLVIMGIEAGQAQALWSLGCFNSIQKFNQAFEKNKAFWLSRMHSIVFNTSDQEFNSWMRWVTIQPVLRRIFGCSFLPDHDYGKGGRGWRDLWQDLLSPILIEPENVHDRLINNFAGVRIDGSNATIIGSTRDEFIADRNEITRVWMDHGAWPLLTVLLYINQTGDYDILLEETTYFRDPQLSRTFERDWAWAPTYGHQLRDSKGNVYQGSLLEHLLLQNLVQFFNVSEHNVTRLESADWNDGLDMAFQRGESVAFMSFYGGNLLALSDLLECLAKKKGISHMQLAKEITTLLDSLSEHQCNYESVQDKRKLLFQKYFSSVQPEISGEKVKVLIKEIVKDLRRKGNWIFEHIRNHEKITVEKKGQAYHWFNGYYDNAGQRIEGRKNGRVRMTLTGQVFPILSGLANDDEIREVIKSVQRFLKDPGLGGIRLNSDFGLSPYLDLGRAFGFAFGTKENGAFFSHMIVMYAYALYKRGFSREGYEVLHSLYRMCVDSKRSKIYPGIPEYFDPQGRGWYHYLTGSASWLVFTQLTQVFGVRGKEGDLVLAPKLVKEQFGEEGRTKVFCKFAGKKLSVCYENPDLLDVGTYQIKEVSLNGQPVPFEKTHPNEVIIKRALIEQAPRKSKIQVRLSKYKGSSVKHS